ncbi:MAG: VOC family protein [Deltaproteobacteria bacterium]|nr:VOC family protein [Deltaproteobacteria bacterium]
MAKKPSKIDHICLAVKNLSAARKTYEDVLGLELDCEYIAESEKIKVARYYVGEVGLELMESTSPDGEVAKFIAKNGEGVFLISYAVDDVAEKMAELKEKGHTLIDKKPRELCNNRYAFINPPQQMCGVLTEIVDGDFELDDSVKTLK